MTYHPDPRSRFVKVRLMPSGELIELPVHRLQKPQQGRRSAGRTWRMCLKFRGWRDAKVLLAIASL
jgi:hypothetical protein